MLIIDSHEHAAVPMPPKKTDKGKKTPATLPREMNRNYVKEKKSFVARNEHKERRKASSKTPSTDKKKLNRVKIFRKHRTSYYWHVTWKILF